MEKMQVVCNWGKKIQVLSKEGKKMRAGYDLEDKYAGNM